MAQSPWRVSRLCQTPCRLLPLPHAFELYSHRIIPFSTTSVAQGQPAHLRPRPNPHHVEPQRAKSQPSSGRFGQRPKQEAHKSRKSEVQKHGRRDRQPHPHSDRQRHSHDDRQQRSRNDKQQHSPQFARGNSVDYKALVSTHRLFEEMVSEGNYRDAALGYIQLREVLPTLHVPKMLSFIGLLRLQAYNMQRKLRTDAKNATDELEDIVKFAQLVSEDVKDGRFVQITARVVDIIIQVFKDLNQPDILEDFFLWVRQGDNRCTLQTYKYIMSDAYLNQGSNIESAESLYNEAIYRFGGEFASYHLSHNAILPHHQEHGLLFRNASAKDMGHFVCNMARIRLQQHVRISS